MSMYKLPTSASDPALAAAGAEGDFSPAMAALSIGTSGADSVSPAPFTVRSVRHTLIRVVC